MNRSGRRLWLPLLLTILLLFILILHEAGYLSFLDTAFQYVAGPALRALSGLTRGVGGAFQTTQDVLELQQQVEDLQQQVNTLTMENVSLQDAQAEAEQLRSMLNFVSGQSDWSYVGSDVVGRDPCSVMPCGQVVGLDTNPYVRYVIISAGSQDGVRVGMPAITSGGGLVGRVSQVGARTSKVQLLIDPSSQVSALLQSSRATGLVVGQADESLVMQYITQGEVVNEGDIVLTSGLGGTLPKGLVIGQVVSVRQLDYEMFQEAVVRPAVDFSRLELVMVVTGFERLPVSDDQPSPYEPVEE